MLGFRAKTGWAAVVLLGGTVDAPRVLDSRRIELCDPGEPDSRQPYHAGFGTFNEDDAEVKRLVRDVGRFAARAMKDLLREHTAAGHAPRAGAVVAGSDIDPLRIANLHMRAHALEGRLYRNLIEEGLAAADLRCEVLLEKQLWQHASARLRQPEAALRQAVAELGRGVVGGWRAENKAAALAAWLVMAGSPSRASSQAPPALRIGTMKVQGIDHVALVVRDVEQSIRWYSDLLGLERRFADVWGDAPAFITVGTTSLALFPVRDGAAQPPPGRNTISMLHLAFRVDGEGFRRAKEELTQRGIAWEFSDHQVSHSIYFSDPDGHQLEITTYELSP